MNAETQAQQENDEVRPVDEVVADETIATAAGAEDTWEENPMSPAAEEDNDAAEAAAVHSESPMADAMEEAEREELDEKIAAKEAGVAASARNKGKKRWYIIQAYTNFEKKVAQAILDEAQLKGIADKFEEVKVPTEEVVEVRRGKKVQTEKRFFPGYVLAKMEMTDATWQLVKNTDKVTGFLGGKGMRPQPISQAEADAIFKQAEEGATSVRSTITFEIGEEVKVIEGPFDSFIGIVEGADDDRQKLKVSVSIFGRSTPVELEYGQVSKIT